MAVQHYSYLMMKMSVPWCDVKQAFTCVKKSYKMAQSHEKALELCRIRLTASTSQEREVNAKKIPKLGEGDAKTKKITLDPIDPSKTAIIGAELDCK